MESITKNRQPIGTLRAMVARAYGADQVPDGDDWVVELGNGWFNVVYRARLRDGARVVLKIAPPAGVEVLTYERGAMDVELAALDLIRARTGVPVPVVDFVDRTRDLCDADYFCMPYVDADNLGVVKENLSASSLFGYRSALGSANRELNTIQGSLFGPLDGPGDASWRSVFGRMFEEVLEDGERRGVDVGFSYSLVRSVFASHAWSLDEVVSPCFVEWDLWEGNVLVRGGSIVSIVDHERAFYGDPLVEAGFAGTLMSAFGDAGGFLSGYGRGGLVGGEVVRRRLYCLHLSLIMVIETVYRGHTDPGPYLWARERMVEAMALFGLSPIV